MCTVYKTDYKSSSLVFHVQFNQHACIGANSMSVVGFSLRIGNTNAQTQAESQGYTQLNRQNGSNTSSGLKGAVDFKFSITLYKLG